MSRQGGIQANTDKSDPAWIHSGEPGTTGREPFEDGTLNAPGAQHHERQHQGFSDNQQSGMQGGASGLVAGALGGSGHHHEHQSHGLTGNEAGFGSDPNSRGQGIASSVLGGNTTGHHHQHGVSDETLGRGGAGNLDGYKDFDNNPSFGDNARSGNNFDGNRVGDRNEAGAMYEGSGGRGPMTGGAAGTDRFDTDRHHAGGEVRGGVDNRGEERAGGLLSKLTTTDDEFTGKDRSHTGANVPGMSAYEDTDGRFKSNTSGPGGNTALTGREGTSGANPIHNATQTGAHAGEPVGRVGQSTEAVHGAHGAHGTHATDPSAEHKSGGIMQKIKDML